MAKKATIISDNDVVDVIDGASNNKQKTLFYRIPGIKDTPIGTAAKHITGFVVGKDADKIDEPYTNAREGLADTARILPWMINPEGSLIRQIAINAAANAASEAVAEKLEGKSFGQSTVGGVGAGGMAGIATGLFGGAGKLLPMTKKPVTKGASIIGRVLSSVPEEDYARALGPALNGKSIFGVSAREDKKLATDLAETLKAAMTKERQGLGQNIGQEMAKLKETPVPFDATAPIAELSDYVKRATSSSGFKRFDGKNIDNFTMMLKSKGLSADDANTIKGMIQDKINQIQVKNADKFSPEAAALEELSSSIDKQLKTQAPELYAKNKEFSDFEKVRQFIANKLKDKNTMGTNLLSNIRRDTEIGDAIRRIEGRLGDASHVSSEADNILTRDKFRGLAPGQGGGSGSEQGAENFARYGALGALTNFIGLPALAAAPLISPVAHKGAIIGISKGVQAANSPLGNATQAILKKIGIQKSAQIGRNASGAYSPQAIQQLRRERGL